MAVEIDACPRSKDRRHLRDRRPCRLAHRQCRRAIVSQEPPFPVASRSRAVFSGLTNPTVVRFASDGRVFVAEKSGLIKVFDSRRDPTPTVFADLRTNVHNFWDRGLLGMALHPNFPTVPYVYVSYTYDHDLGDPAPAPSWGRRA